MRRADPARAGWTTEVFAAQAEPLLEGFFERLLAEPGTLVEELGAAFEGATSLVPENLVTDFEGAGLSVGRGSGYSSELSDDLNEIGAALAERLSEGPSEAAPELSVDVNLVGIEVNGGAYDTRALVQLARRGDAAIQIDLEVAAGWTAEDPAVPRLVDVRLESFEMTESARPLFAELTEYALGETKHYEDHLLRGVGAFVGRTDRIAGLSFQGMQGIAVGDVNGDGLDDIYVCQQVGLPNQLLIASEDGRFRDVAAASSVDLIDLTRAALILDWNNDGHQDLVLAMAASIYLCLNDGTGTFAKPERFDATGGAHFYNLSAADADGDGDLDLYAGRYSVAGLMQGAPAPYHDAANGAASYLLLNAGPGADPSMVDGTESSGLAAGNTRFTLSSIWEDFDDDGDLDLYLVNDFGSNNLFQNDGKGHFVDVAAETGALDIGAGMGATVADYDLDGDLDLYVTNMWSASGQRIVQQSDQFLDGQHRELHRFYTKHASGNSLLSNNGDGTFEDVTSTVGGALGRWAWGGVFVDFDNDAYQDLYVPCGQTTKEGATDDLEGFFWRGVISHTPMDGSVKSLYREAFTAIHYLLLHRDYHWSGLERNVAYKNLGGHRFADVSAVSGTDFIGDGRAAALLDWDGDGFQDMVVKSRTAPRLRLLHNRSQSGHRSVSFSLRGVHCNRDAIGARVTVEADGKRLMKRLYAGDGFLSQSSKTLHFGLGDAEGIERVIVDWPDGSRNEYEGLSASSHFELVQGEETAKVRTRPDSPDASASARFDAHVLPSGSPRPNTTPVTRIPLFQSLPLRPFPLPALDNPGRTIGDYRGAPLVVHFWTAAHPSGRAGLAALAAARELASESGARFVALSLDEGPYLARARKESTANGLESGYADGRTLAIYEVVALEVLDVFEDLPVPFTLVLDHKGRLVTLYCGMPDPAALAHDLNLVARRDNEGLAQLRGGLQVVPRRRQLSRMASIFETHGVQSITQFFQGLVAASRK